MIRKLGCVERIAWMREQRAPNNFVINLQFSGYISKDALAQALNILKIKYPPLAFGIVQHSVHGPIFIDARESELEFANLRYVDNLTQSQLVYEVEKELNTKFDLAKAPLVRVVYLARGREQKLSGSLIITVNHIICDGVALAHMANDLLQIISYIQSGHNEMIHCARYRESRPIENYLLNGVEYENFEVDTAKQYKVNKINLAKMPANLLVTKCNFYAFSKSETELLIKLCRHHGVTVTNAISAALFKAFYANINMIDESLDPTADVSVIYNIPINMRPYCHADDGIKLDASDMGCLTSSVDLFCSLKADGDYWNLAYELHHELRQKIAANYHLQKLGKRIKATKNLCAPNEKYHDVFKHHASQGLSGIDKFSLPMFYISNLGKISFAKDYANFSVADVNIMVNVHDILNSNANYLLLIYTNTATGQLSLALHYPSPIISVELANFMLHSTVNYINNAIHGAEISNE